ncbi:hypothetical protein F4821DRAFT_223311 [Hypoxylon rubiginosum]|uniref:Uncharacterized protein n=1 Tax=Hypoxylon rubiginosum TaxID=110542 RepID=A0ACC0DJ59_9PEZI|nr:hypothetical protein F4821DRAFT_223311 [Hypoxylon rubiginosum]
MERGVIHLYYLVLQSALASHLAPCCRQQRFLRHYTLKYTYFVRLCMFFSTAQTNPRAPAFSHQPVKTLDHEYEQRS